MKKDETQLQEEFQDKVLSRLIAIHDSDEHFIYELVNHLAEYMPNVVDNAIDYLTKREE